MTMKTGAPVGSGAMIQAVSCGLVRFADVAPAMRIVAAVMRIVAAVMRIDADVMKVVAAMWVVAAAQKTPKKIVGRVAVAAPGLVTASAAAGTLVAARIFLPTLQSAKA